MPTVSPASGSADSAPSVDPAGVVVVRPGLADGLRGDVPGLQVSAVERPAGPGQAGAVLEVDGVERADGQTLVGRPVPRRSAEGSDP